MLKCNIFVIVFMFLCIIVEQLPTIITHTSGPIIALPFDNTVTVRCVARGNPPPEYRWTKDGKDFIPPHITSNSTDPTHGTFVLPNKHLMQFQGKYRCYASNKLGTAMTEEIELIVPGIPKFPKEVLDPIVVKEGGPVILKCNPPQGVAPRQIYWMSISLQHIEQNERVTMGIDGNLYFSNALQKDSRQDYCCYAAFSKIRTIVQKTAMAVVVNSCKFAKYSAQERICSLSVYQRDCMYILPFLLQEHCHCVIIHYHLYPLWLTMSLSCCSPTPTIKWMKLGDKLSPRTKYNKFKKLLIIPAVEERDQGKYMCTADNTVGEAVHYFDVIVEEPPTWLTGPPQSQLTVIGTDVHVKCSVTGKPPPDITWRRNGELLRVLDDTVVLHNARPEDTAVYQCEASNRHGSVMANINIMVINMAPLILTRDNQEYAVVLGGDITMNCSVFSSPPSAISWVKKKSSKAIDEERFFALQNGSLQIISAEKNDSGKYVCIAFNSLGKTEVTALLDVKDVQIISGTTAQLMCQTEYDKSLQSTFKVVWTKDGKEIPFSLEKNSRYFVDNGMLQIMNVNLSDQGMYTCIARTSLDEDNATALLTVLDVPDAPKNLEISELESPRNVRLKNRKSYHWDPGRWKELQKVPGNQATAELMLHGHLDYRFRAYAVNAIGPGPPSEPSERYKTPPAAPDRNPENIKIQGHLPHQMDISWEPLLPIEQNGPGLEYQVSYRKLGVEEAWNDHLVQRHSIVVTNTPTFVPYEVRIRSRNSYGWAPEPKVVTGYSGEDVPTTAPQDVAVEVINTTVLRVSWTPVPPATVRGHLGGYNIHWLRKRNLLNPNKILDERQFLIFPGKRSHAVVPGLKPFSDYRLTVSVFNKKGNGPNSDPVTFNTPEGVPEQVPVLTASNAQKDSILLVWGPPLEANGILTGYLLQYHLINETTLEVVDSQERNITGAETTQLQLQGLEEGSLYRFHISACTRAGCGPPLAEESNTMTTGDGNWWISNAVNTSQSFHVIDGLKPGAVYTIRLMAKRLLENASIFEDVIQTRVKGVEGQHSDFSTQGWFIGTMCAVAFLTLIALMACFLQRNKGGKYAVKEKEDLHPDVESQGMNDDTFCEYSDSEEKPLKGSSLCSLNEDDTVGDSLSQDSLVDYADGGGEFNEDGSFIGFYSKPEDMSREQNGKNTTTTDIKTI
uniref:Neural cell adhesion molecule L1-like protein n=1 Tax=Mastacembelus armatus TaxID=205130 RepID=A0A7N9AZB9_9TELE